jgi:hypothetical protein
MTHIDPSVMVINVEDYPDIDPNTVEGKDQLSSIAFSLHTPNKYHFLFHYKGEQIGEMIIRSMLFNELTNH